MRYRFWLPAFLGLYLLAACKKDNKEAPGSTLTGRVVVAGTKQPVGVASNGTQLELWQDGFALRQKIPVHIDQDGRFSARLFDGTYKMVRLSGAPWANNADTILVNLSGAAEVEVPVNPFFNIGGDSYTFNRADTSLTAVFSVNRLDASKNADRVSVSIGLTTFVDAQTNQIPFSPNILNDMAPPSNYLSAPVTIKVFLNPARHPNYRDAQNREINNAELRRQLGEALRKGYAFVRAGVRTTGITQRFYTQVKEIALK